MYIKDIEVGKTYRYALGTGTDAETGVVTVNATDGGNWMFPIIGPCTIEGNPDWEKDAEGMFSADELIEEV